MEKRKTNALQLPSWYMEDLIGTFRSELNYVYIVSGDTNCLVPNPVKDENEEKPYIPLKQFWEKVFRSWELLIFYNIASGVQFPDPSMEELFKRQAGIKPDAASGDPIAAAKADLASKKGIPREPEAALALIEKVLENTEETALIVNTLHFIAPDSNGSGVAYAGAWVNIERIRNWARNQKIRENGNIVILLTEEPGKVAPELRKSSSGIRQIRIPKPGKEERKSFIERLSRNSSLSVRMPKNLKPDVLAHATQGIGLEQISDLFLQAKNEKGAFDLDLVKKKKREILNIEYKDVMEIIEPVRSLKYIAGMQHIKDYFATILEALAKGEYRLVPPGIVIMGPPGTGKTALVEALAFESGFNLIKSTNLRSMWLGQSEEKQLKFLYGAKTMAPVVIMNDEADLGEASRDAVKGDSGVSDRFMKYRMEFMSDPRIRGQVIIISLTNRADRIDPALKRSGRSDELILLPMPSLEELPEIFRVMFAYHKVPTSLKDFLPFVKMTDGRSGADVEKMVLKSFRFAFQMGKKEVDRDALVAAIEDTIPSANQAEIDRMTLIGILEASSKMLLPKNIKSILEGIKERRLVQGMDEMVREVERRGIVS